MEKDYVIKEYPVIWLKPKTNQGVQRFLFHQPYLQSMKDCQGRLKAQVKYMELAYNCLLNPNGLPADKTAELHNGIYVGESSTLREPLFQHTAGFFHSGTLYMVKVNDTYEMRRRIEKPLKAKTPQELNKLDEAKMAEHMELKPNPVRVTFARTETEWQKNRREKSAQHKQQLFENDPWIGFGVKKGDISQIC